MSSSDPDLVDRPDRSRSRSFLRMATGFWTGLSGVRAWLLTIMVLGFAFAQIAAQVGINSWNRMFFDALEKKEIGDVVTAISLLPLLVGVAAITMSGLVVSRMLLQVRWREWVTHRLAGWWIADQRYYRLGFLATEHSAPEFRIAEDVRISTEPLVEFAIGLISAFVTAVTFAAIVVAWAASAVPVTLTAVTLSRAVKVRAATSVAVPETAAIAVVPLCVAFRMVCACAVVAVPVAVMSVSAGGVIPQLVSAVAMFATVSESA